MLTSNRDELRGIFFDVWQRHQEKLPLDAQQTQILDIILLHPEYHHYFNHKEQYQNYNFKDDNPFLHLSLHLAVREQIHLDKPAGIKEIFNYLQNKFNNDSLLIEHQMMMCLADILWEAQEKNIAPDERQYLKLLKKLL